MSVDASIDISSYTFYTGRIDRIHVGWLAPTPDAPPKAVWQQLENRKPPYCSLSCRFSTDYSRTGRTVRPKDIATWVPGLNPFTDFEGPIRLVKATKQREFVWHLLKARKEQQGLGGVLPFLDRNDVIRTGLYGATGRNLKKGLTALVPTPPASLRDRDGGTINQQRAGVEHASGALSDQYEDELSDTSVISDVEQAFMDGKGENTAMDALELDGMTSMDILHADEQEQALTSTDEDFSEEAEDDDEDLRPVFSTAANKVFKSPQAPAMTSNKACAARFTQPQSSIKPLGDVQNTAKRKRTPSEADSPPPVFHGDHRLQCGVHSRRFKDLHREWERAMVELPADQLVRLNAEVSDLSARAEQCTAVLRALFDVQIAKQGRSFR